MTRQVYQDYKDNEHENSDKVLAVNIVRGNVDSKERILMRIPFESIYFIEAANRKIRYVLKTNVYSDSTTLTERESELDERFVRCHHAFIVNVEKIRSFNYAKSNIHMQNGDIIPVSRAKKKHLKQVLIELHMNIASDYNDDVEEVLNVQ